MSLYGEGIIERLHDKSVLHDPNHPMHKIIDKGLGEWLDDFDDNYLGEEVFLESATGEWLDLHGKDFGVQREVNESDDDYRQRIVYEGLGHLTTSYLVDVYGLSLYCYVEDYSVEENTLTSDNPYLCSKHMAFVSDELQSILGKKFVIGSELAFLDVVE